MSKEKNKTGTEVQDTIAEDGVQYRKAKLYQVISYALGSMTGMGVYVLISLASYSASIGYGIATTVIGVILMCTRIFDAFTDPIVAFVFDKVNTKHGKIRLLMVTGFIIEAIALTGMFHILSGKGHGVPAFTLLYLLYVVGYTLHNITNQTIPSLMSNDPKQRPTIGVWTTAVNYLTPMTLNIILTVVLLPKFGGDYNQAFLSTACFVCLAVCAAGVVFSVIAVSKYDIPENFSASEKQAQSNLKLRDMWEVLKHNRPLQCYIASAASDKLAIQVASQSIITTMLFGILIGNMGMSTILSAISMLPSMIFAVIGAKYAGKHGSQNSIITWTKVCIAVAAVSVVFFVVIDPKNIAHFSFAMVGFVILNFAINGTKMCVTTADTAFMSDIIDYETARSGNYVPAVVTGVYSLIDKLVSAVSATIATGAVALIGYHNTVPQPSDPSTPAVFWMTMALFYGLPAIGWILTLIAMRFCHLDKDAMVEVQKKIAEQKGELEAEMAAES